MLFTVVAHLFSVLLDFLSLLARSEREKDLEILLLQYLEMMTNMPMGHPFRRPAVWGELPRPLLLAPLARVSELRLRKML